jgi:chromosome transmission fidelity protein 1
MRWQAPTSTPAYLLPCCSYVRESKVVYKIAGFWQAEQKREAAAAAAASAGDSVPLNGGGSSRAGARTGAEAAAAAAAEGGPASAAGTGALHALVSFLQALTNADADGRIVVHPPQQLLQGQPQGQQSGQAAAAGGAAAEASSSSSGGGGHLKFVLLNAAAHFGAVVSAAHALVLASGTLSPLASLLHLFPGLPQERLHHYACGHVVGKERCALGGTSGWGYLLHGCKACGRVV